jgi:hypothetical protein
MHQERRWPSFLEVRGKRLERIANLYFPLERKKRSLRDANFFFLPVGFLLRLLALFLLLAQHFDDRSDDENRREEYK